MSYTELFYLLSSGGWMMLGNYTANNALKVVGFKAFHNLPDGNILMKNTFLKDLEALSHFGQIRVYCYKPSVGRVVHFTTKLNEMGIKIRNMTVANTGFTGYNIDVKKGLQALPGDQSRIVEGANTAGFATGDWGYHKYMVYVDQEAYVNIINSPGSKTLQCDDAGSDNEGSFEFYIR